MPKEKYLRLKLTLMSPTGKQETGELIIDGKNMSALFTCSDPTLAKKLYDKDKETGTENTEYNKKVNGYIQRFPNYTKTRMVKKIYKELKRNGMKVKNKVEEN